MRRSTPFIRSAFPSAFLLAFLAAGVAAPAWAQLAPGQVDTFEDGTVQGWTVGAQHPTPPANVATGGPAGADDGHLRLTATGGNGPGSKLSAFNEAQWAGDYAAGVTSIRMDLRNFGPEEAHVRLRLSDAMGGPPSNVAITDAVVLPAAGDWTAVTFAIDPASLTTLRGSAAGALSNATELRIFHNPDPTFPPPPTGPPPVNLQLGVDNIQAVPEPSAALAAAGLLVVLARRGRRRGGADEAAR